jgi:hypothetical protein
MKTFRTYNTKLTEIPGWPTTCKRGSVEVHDTNNNLAFVIDFGKNPTIRVYEYSNEDFHGCLFEKKLVLTSKK